MTPQGSVLLIEPVFIDDTHYGVYYQDSGWYIKRVAPKDFGVWECCD